jgi:hypothetical protein
MLIEVALSQRVMTVVVDIFSMIMQIMTGVKEEGTICGGLDGHCEAHFIFRALWTVVKTVHSIGVVWKASGMCLCSSRFDWGRATTPKFGASGLPKKEGDSQGGYSRSRSPSIMYLVALRLAGCIFKPSPSTKDPSFFHGTHFPSDLLAWYHW